MRIKRLRLSGFKSFVEPAELRIEPGLTGVVGPNGCGKSNLLEALRWTMGEGSAKSLRGAGMDDVIFAGTATRPPRNVAEVAITADRAGPDGQGHEVEVVRRIERGAGSAYRIDGRDVRAKDVALLFADAATGAHSPALVSQGRIGAVIAARPEDRRLMLEEAAGIAGLHVRRRDAEAKLRATEANLARADELLADADTRAAALRRQARAAERYRQVSARIVVAEARALFARWREAKAAADTARAEAAAAETAVAATAATERDAAQAQADAIERALDARVAATHARDAAGAAAHRLAAARAEQAGATRRLAELHAARARIDADRAREDAVAIDAAAALVRLDADTAALATAIAAEERTLPDLDAALIAAEREGQAAEVALAQAIGVQATEAAETRVATAALAAARARLDRAARDAADLARAAAAVPDSAPIEAARAAAVDAKARASSAVAAARTALAAADAAEPASLAARDEAEAAHAAARAALSAIEAEAKALARAAPAKGGERMIDRIRVAPGFERALAAALGDDLDAPLAAWGTADRLGHDPAPPGDAELLAAHVDAPPALARRLAQLFVVENDDSRALAAGQRLVTRAGALRRWDGYRSDGGGTAAAAALERRNRLAALDAARPAATAARDAAAATLDARTRAIAAIRADAAAARAALTRADADARDAARAEDAAAARLDRLESQRADLATRRHRLAAETAEATTAHDEAAAALAALPARAATDAAVAGLRTAAERARAAIAQARTDRAQADRRLAAARERRAATVAEARGQRARAGEAAVRLKAMAEAEATLTAEIAALAPRPAALAAEVATLAHAHDTARAAVGSLEAAERTATADQTVAAAAHARATAALGDAREARAGASARAEHHEAARVAIGGTSGTRFGCPAPVLPERHGFAPAEVLAPAAEQATHDRLVAERERIGPVNLVAEQELADLDTATGQARADHAELTEAVARLRGTIALLNREGRDRLRAAFEAVDAHFRRLFAILFDAGKGDGGKGDGGTAHLALVDADDPLEAGLEIMAQPPGKRLQSLTLLSGGEQALTAVALIFALFLTNPAPICVLDEVDAPLDDANIDRFCGLLERMAADTDTRYLIVTHNAVTMSRMHRLFGVTMVERGVSRLVSVDLQAAAAMAAE